MFNHRYKPLDTGETQTVGTMEVKGYKGVLLIMFLGTDIDWGPTAYLESRRAAEDEGSEG